MAMECLCCSYHTDQRGCSRHEGDVSSGDVAHQDLHLQLTLTLRQPNFSSVLGRCARVYENTMVADEYEQPAAAEITPTPSSRTAAWPFDDTETDLIIRSSDGVDFHVLRKIMSIASPNIKSRLAALPSAVDGPQILDIPAHSTTLDQLLRHCYPVDFPSFDHIELLEPVLKLAIAYEFKLAINVLTERLRTNLNASIWDALRVYACACRLSLHTEKQLALKILGSKQAGELDSPIFDDIAATDYIQLIRYNRKIKIPVQDASAPSVTAETHAITAAPAPFNDPDADVILRSSDNVDFRVYKSIMSLISPIFHDMFTLPQEPPVSSKGDQSNPPLVHLAEDHVILSDLLQLCYPPSPIDTHLTEDFDRLRCALSAGMKYDMLAAVRLISNHLEQCARRDPGSVYAIARYMELDSLALAAAKLSLQKSLPDLEVSSQWKHIRAADFRRLQHYHTACGISAAAVTTCPKRQAPRWFSRGTQRWIYRDCHCGPPMNPKAKSPSPGWDRCMSKTADQLKLRPGANSSITSLASLWNSAVNTESFNCDDCCNTLPTYLAEMQTFCTEMKAEVQRRLNQVRR